MRRKSKQIIKRLLVEHIDCLQDSVAQLIMNGNLSLSKKMKKPSADVLRVRNLASLIKQAQTALKDLK